MQSNAMPVLNYIVIKIFVRNLNGILKALIYEIPTYNFKFEFESVYLPDYDYYYKLKLRNSFNRDYYNQFLLFENLNLNLKKQRFPHIRRASF